MTTTDRPIFAIVEAPPTVVRSPEARAALVEGLSYEERGDLLYVLAADPRLAGATFDWLVDTILMARETPVDG